MIYFGNFVHNIPVWISSRGKRIYTQLLPQYISQILWYIAEIKSCILCTKLISNTLPRHPIFYLVKQIPSMQEVLWYNYYINFVVRWFILHEIAKPQFHPPWDSLAPPWLNYPAKDETHSVCADEIHAHTMGIKNEVYIIHCTCIYGPWLETTTNLKSTMRVL